MLPVLLGVTACGAEATPAQEKDHSPLASVGAPVEGVSTATSLPPLQNGAPNVETGYMSTWADLLAPPVPLDDAWLSTATSDLYTTPASLAPQLRAAKQEVERRVNKARVDVPREITELTKLFSYYQPESGQSQLIGYTPERARWLSERSQNGQLQTFDDPYSFAEMRQRGARLYCAATAAYNHRTRANRVMGKTMAAGMNVLGLPLDLMVVEPTISMSKPMRFDTGKADGGQAFVVPFQAGVRARPVSFLFGLPELSVPVGFVTADSEVQSRAFASGGNYDKWMTMSHMDGFASLSQPYLNSETPEFPFLTLGPLTFSAKVGMDMGTAACAQAATYDDCKNGALQNPGRLYAQTTEADGKATAWPGRPGGWTTKGATGPFAYNDGPWNINTSTWFASPTDNSYSIPTRLPDPLAGRMLQNNDKSMEVHTSSGATVSLVASGGLHTDWIDLSVQGTGSFRAGVDTVHRFREQEDILILPPPSNNPEAEFNFPVPAMVTSFSVTPASATEFTFGVGLGVEVALHLGFLDKSFSKELLKATASTSTGLEDWSEDRRLRMDTAISDGTNANFNVLSHWPRDAAYGTYETIDQCQAPQTQVVDDDPPCAAANQDKPTPGQFQPFKANLCLWRDIYSLPPDDKTSTEDQCWQLMKPWLYGGVHQEQLWHSTYEYKIARVIQFDNAADMAALQSALTQCDAIYAKANRTADFGNTIDFAFCDGSAKLFENAVEPVVNTNPAPVAGAPGDPDSCD